MVVCPERYLDTYLGQYLFCLYREYFCYYDDAFSIQHCTYCRGGSIWVQVQQCSEVGKQENACGALVIRVYRGRLLET